MATKKETKNPWDALFTSTTRPISIATGAGAFQPKPLGGYTILIQHSITSASQRLHALSSTLSSNASAASVSRPFESRQDFFGLSSALLVRNSFNELCVRCEGAVVFVSVIGNNGVVNLTELENGKFSNECHENSIGAGQNEMNKRRDALEYFRRNGAVIDLASNPFGWDDEIQTVSDTFVTTSTMNNLQSIADAVRSAAAIVESRRSAQNITTQSQNQTGDMIRPIPIIFDSLTPLLALHGAKNVSMLLQSFKHYNMSNDSSQSILSPIIAPILYESIQPSDHRILEDNADAFLSLQLKDVSKNDAVASGVLGVVRRGGAGSGLGGKLMRGCIPVHVMAAENRHDIDAFYWLMEKNDDKTKEEGIEQITQGATHIQLSSGNVGENKMEKEASRPKIYFESDDPEFNDFDEEDPDDDLDL